MSGLVGFAETHPWFPWTVGIAVLLFVVLPTVEWLHERHEHRRYVRAFEQWLERAR